ncbi:class I SAM-dependent methyltransferase [Brevibacillus sp. AY1]|uniref:class I SAM-dependent methyltransferase n=1 Tax=Brevibacillus sp. AY1 TaxID=2807621 RepID=UPI002454178D|nr:class I SAM-dependent methyltransferase [Brevibacillus sp. AY1]MDH4616514.1 class I SAM-dependent methyltransferase [Brevibacillus sp. AY1]
MEYRGSDFYDNPDHFERYMERRKAEENANDTLEKPVFQELLGCVKGLRILDIGCGDANFGRECLANGCAAYVGLEGSINMVHAARKTLEGWDGQIVHARMEDWDYPQAEYDLVLSRLAIHYVQDLNSLLQNIYQTPVRAHFLTDETYERRLRIPLFLFYSAKKK